MEDYSNLIVVPWFILAAVACGMTAVNSLRRGKNQGFRDATMWMGFAVIFGLFIFMKAQKVVQFLGEEARQETRQVGMYEERHPYQQVAVIGAAVLGVAQATYFSRYIAQRWRRYRWPLIGTGAIICFGIMRAVSWHPLDALGTWMAAAKAVVESLAAVMVIWGAMRRYRSLRNPHTHEHTRD